MTRILPTILCLLSIACSSGEEKGETPVPLVTTVTEYPTCFVLSFGIKSDAAAGWPMAHDAKINGLKLRLASGESVDVMEQRFFWEEGGGELMVRLGKVPSGTMKLASRGAFQAFDATGRPIGVSQDLPATIDISSPQYLDYKLTASLAPTDEDTSMWLDIDAALARPLHASGLPGARIDRLRISGPSGAIEALGSQTFMATAAGGKIRIKVPTMESGARVKLNGWWVPLRTDNTPCCGEQSLPSYVDVAAKDIQSVRSLP